MLNGNPFKADVVYDEIYRQAKQSILEDPDCKKYDSMIKDLLKNKQLVLK